MHGNGPVEDCRSKVSPETGEMVRDGDTGSGPSGGSNFRPTEHVAQKWEPVLRDMLG